MAKMRISPELKKLIEKYRCVKDTEGMSPAKVYKLVGENENLYLKMTDSRYKGTTYDVEREKDMMLWLEGKLPVPKVLHFERHDGWSKRTFYKGIYETGIEAAGVCRCRQKADRMGGVDGTGERSSDGDRPAARF